MASNPIKKPAKEAQRIQTFKAWCLSQEDPDRQQIWNVVKDREKNVAYVNHYIDQLIKVCIYEE